jgi:SAM-dependent methyltransferase
MIVFLLRRDGHIEILKEIDVDCEPIPSNDRQEAPDLQELLALLHSYQQRPDAFAPGEPCFWDDPYICAHLLAGQVDARSDGASRRRKVVELEVAWLIEVLKLEPGRTVLDLGCGPGLYATQLASRGLTVTGIDYAHCAIAYAREQAASQGLDITYRYQDYLSLEDEGAFDAVLLVNGDYSSHSAAERRRLLGHIHRALKPGGRLALDVLTRAHQARYGIRNQWYVARGGIWRPGLHLVLEEGFRYPEQAITLNQYVIADPNGAVTVYRNWFQAFTPASIAAELEAHGFGVDLVGGDMRGSAYSEQAEWLGVLAQRI